MRGDGRGKWRTTEVGNCEGRTDLNFSVLGRVQLLV